MAIEYRTEYRLGRRGRVFRTYGGVRALVAIALDLVLDSAFGLVGLGLWLVRMVVVTTYRVVIGLPLRAARAVSDACSARPFAKPARPAFDEF